MLVTIMALLATAPRHTPKPYKFVPRYLNSAKPIDWAWTKESWMGSDSDYLKADKALDAEASKLKEQQTNRWQPVRPGGYEGLTDKYRSLAILNPKDAFAQYKWAYCAYRAASDRSCTLEHGLALLNGVDYALARARSPHSYEYDRLQFLIDEYCCPCRQLVEVAPRFINRNPRDRRVLIAYAAMLANSNRKDIDRALAYANELLADQPNDPAAAGLRSGCYYRIWFLTHTRPAADQAIDASQHFLDIAPSDDVRRESAEWAIDFIRKRQAEWERGTAR